MSTLVMGIALGVGSVATGAGLAVLTVALIYWLVS